MHANHVQLRWPAVLLLLSSFGCKPRAPVTLEGEIFGGTWAVTIVGPAGDQYPGLEARIQTTLTAVEQSVSSWRDDSDISRINRAAVGEAVQVSALTMSLLQQAIALHGTSAGSFDITLAPLLDVWGFSPRTKGRVVQLPQPDVIAAARAKLGIQHIALAGSTVKKTAPIVIDITSIGDGAAAEAVMSLLQAEGVHDALVDVAGEVVVIGKGVSGPWRIGINTPSRDALPSDRIHTVELTGTPGRRALSTSGTYRERFELLPSGGPTGDLDGASVNHIIDPRTGRPVSGSLVSCTIIADDIVVADALSTACLVLGKVATTAALPAGAQAVYVDDRGAGQFAVVTAP